MPAQWVQTVEALQALLQTHDLQVSLSNGLLRSSHYLSLDGSKVIDRSMADGSDRRYTWHQFQRSGWGKALKSGGLGVTLSNRRG